MGLKMDRVELAKVLVDSLEDDNGNDADTSPLDEADNDADAESEEPTAKSKNMHRAAAHAALTRKASTTPPVPTPSMTLDVNNIQSHREMSLTLPGLSPVSRPRPILQRNFSSAGDLGEIYEVECDELTQRTSAGGTTNAEDLRTGGNITPVSTDTTEKGLIRPIVMSKTETRVEHHWKPAQDEQTAPPHWRLVPLLAASLLAPASLFLFAWTTRQSVPFVVPVVGMSLFAASALVAQLSALLYISASCQGLANEESQAVQGLSTVLTFVLSGAVILFAGPMVNNLGVGLGVSILGIFQVVLAASVWTLAVKSRKRV